MMECVATILMLAAIVLGVQPSPVPQSNPQVQTKYGIVEGRTLMVEPYKKLVSRFLGIPFAKPPLGNRRWKAPEEPEKWEGVRRSNDLNDACPQTTAGLIWITHPGWSRYSEDCLYLNIFSPANVTAGPYPVMVWLHGGGFQGSANVQYPGHFLAAHDVVVVVPNYRLGIFGFLSTADKAAPGNFGLLDQLRALRFVQENIRNFGGDPSKVTLFGQSAGAASSGLLSLSPRAKGLFHQAITQSGSDQAIWAVFPPQGHPENYTKEVARKLNCEKTSSEDMLQCMRAIEWKKVFENSDFTCTPGYFCQGFTPVVDGAVLPEDPWTLREKKKFANIPLMSGQCTEDGSMYTIVLIPESLDGGFNRSTFEHHLRHSLVARFSPLFPDKENEVFNAINWYHSPWPYLEDLEGNRQAFNHLITDFGFGFTGDLQMKSQSEENDVYFYLMGYRSSNAKEVVPEWLGVPHNGELPYMLGWPLLQKNMDIRWDSGILIDLIQWNNEDIEWATYFLQMWTNFAKYGNPTPVPVKAPGNNNATSWKKFKPDEMNYQLFKRQISEEINYRQRDFALWREYLPEVAGIDFVRPRPPPQELSSEGGMRTGEWQKEVDSAYRSLVEARLKKLGVNID